MLPDDLEKKVVLDGITLLAGFSDDAQRYPTEIEVMAAIREFCRHKIVVTESVRREYERETKRFPAVRWQSELQRLTADMTDKVRGRASRTLRDVQRQSLPGRHRGYLVGAIESEARFFVTRNQSWLRLRERLSRAYGLQVVTPEEYLSVLRA